MAIPSNSVFHAGELQAQEKAGTHGVAMELSVVQRSRLNFSSNHDAFLAAQSFAVVSSVDKDEKVWVTPLFGKEGDLSAASETEILIKKRSIPPNDVLRNAKPGAPMAMLGIDLNKRIRHRIMGVVGDESSDSNANVHFNVKEYSPNCPKYINRRELVQGAEPIMNPTATREERSSFTEADKHFVSKMDTLWLGTQAFGGADVNHRGGRPGFIRVPNTNTIEWPEYRGNGMFYSSGNLESNDRAGVALFDFSTGDMMQLTGRAKVTWDYDGEYEGATRLMTFVIEKIVWTSNVTSHRWKRLDYSPYNPTVGDAEEDGNTSEYPTLVTLAKIVIESPSVKTFRWVAQRQIPFLPGQYATFEFDKLPEDKSSETSHVRTWTLSETPNSIKGDNTLDITVKRIPGGVVTNWLHDHAQPGLQVKLLGVQGDMTAVRFDENDKVVVPKHLLLLSAGIGITPNLAMVRGVGAFQLQNETNITMIHVERNWEDLLSDGELARRARNYPSFQRTNIISSEEGRLTREKLRELVPEPIQEQEAYICGPNGFMLDMTAHLAALGVPAAQIHTESFDF